MLYFRLNGAEMSRRAAGRDDVRPSFRLLLRELAAELKKHYGARLVAAVVFGSVGRGVPRADSDVDLLIVADPLPDGRMARVRDFVPVKKALAGRLAGL